MLNLKGKNIKNNRKKGGFTAIELLFGLGIIAVGTAALVLWSRSNSDKQNANTMVSDVSALVQNIQSAYASSAKGYEGLSTEAAINMKLVPLDLIIKDASTIKSRFQNGTVAISAAGTNNDSFTITYTFVPASVCVSVATTLAGSSFSSVKIGENVVYDADTPLNPATVGTSCGGSGSSTTSTATMVFTSS